MVIIILKVIPTTWYVIVNKHNYHATHHMIVRLTESSFQQNQNYQSHTPHLIILPDNESVVVVLLFLSVIGYVDL